MAEKEARPELDPLEDIQDEDITLSSTELEDIIHSAEFTEEPGVDEQQLEKYGVWVKVKPEPVSVAEPEDNSFELADLDREAAEPAEGKLSPKEEELLAELDEELSGGAPAPAAAADRAAGAPDLESLDDLDLPDLEDIPPAPARPAAQVRGAAAAGGLPVHRGDFREESYLEDLPALDEEVLEDVATPAGPAAAVADEDIEVALSDREEAPFDDLAVAERDLEEVKREAAPALDSSGILQRIEQELESIRREILGLKKELSGIGRDAEAVEEVAVEPVDDDAKGFFDEEEDETIALTGDELDNILNTADVTEETSAAAAETLEEESPVEPAAAVLPDELPDESLLETLDLSPAAAPPLETAGEALVDREDLIDLDLASGLTPPAAAPAGEAFSEPADMEDGDLEVEEAEPEPLEALPDELPSLEDAVAEMPDTPLQPEAAFEEPAPAGAVEEEELDLQAPEPLDLDGEEDLELELPDLEEVSEPSFRGDPARRPVRGDPAGRTGRPGGPVFGRRRSGGPVFRGRNLGRFRRGDDPRGERPRSAHAGGPGARRRGRDGGGRSPPGAGRGAAVHRRGTRRSRRPVSRGAPPRSDSLELTLDEELVLEEEPGDGYVEELPAGRSRSRTPRWRSWRAWKASRSRSAARKKRTPNPPWRRSPSPRSPTRGAAAGRATTTSPPRAPRSPTTCRPT